MNHTLKPLFSSLRLNWRTPKELYRQLDNEFHFDFDPSPPDPTFDGLSIEWGQCNFVNPPYGKETIRWCAKAVVEWSKGKTVVMLLAARTDTKWFQDYCLPYATEIRFIRGRLKFDDSEGSAPFPSCIVVFDGRETKARERK
jgi:site-specific DNA-methyltransferase (adenine-specific)